MGPGYRKKRIALRDLVHLRLGSGCVVMGGCAAGGYAAGDKKSLSGMQLGRIVYRIGFRDGIGVTP